MDTPKTNDGGVGDFIAAAKMQPADPHIAPKIEALRQTVAKFARNHPQDALVMLERINDLSSAITAMTERLIEHNIRVVQLAEKCRLDMQYILFDLEATRRERDELRRKLEDLGNDSKL